MGDGYEQMQNNDYIHWEKGFNMAKKNYGYEKITVYHDLMLLSNMISNWMSISVALGDRLIINTRIVTIGN